MTDYLVFRLYAPLASWGEAAVGGMRPTATHPGRGAIIGLLGAALGIRRDDEEGQQRLRDSVRVAVKQYSPGLLMRDYHTAQVPTSQPKKVYRTRRDELNAPEKLINTILSSRDYRCDGLWTVAIWSPEKAKISLAEMENALQQPYFMLYLGRKSCPPAAPLAPRQVQAETLKSALDTSFPPLTASKHADHRLLGLASAGDALYVWEGKADLLEGDGAGVESNDVWDDPISRARWQFGPRTSYRRFIRDADHRETS